MRIPEYISEQLQALNELKYKIVRDFIEQNDPDMIKTIEGFYTSIKDTSHRVRQIKEYADQNNIPIAVMLAFMPRDV